MLHFNIILPYYMDCTFFPDSLWRMSVTPPPSEDSDISISFNRSMIHVSIKLKHSWVYDELWAGKNSPGTVLCISPYKMELVHSYSGSFSRGFQNNSGYETHICHRGNLRTTESDMFPVQIWGVLFNWKLFGMRRAGGHGIGSCTQCHLTL